MDLARLPALGDPDRATVEAALRRGTLAPRHRERLEMVKAAALGFDLAAICAWSGRDGRTVRRWLVAFAAGGVDALADAPARADPRKPTPPLWPRWTPRSRRRRGRWGWASTCGPRSA